jgi:hypothetical protein
MNGKSFFPEDFNVSKKGVNIPWHIFFKSSTPNLQFSSIPKATKTIAKTKNHRQLKKNSKTSAKSVQNNTIDQQSSASVTKNLIPDLIFPTNPDLSIPEKSSDSESIEFLFDTLSSQQNDLLQQAISSVHSAQPTEENTISYLAQPGIENSVPTSSQVTFSSTQIIAEKSATLSAQPVLEISANQIHSNHQNSSNHFELKMATAINNLTTKISALQQNFNCELEIIKNDLKKLQKVSTNFV